LEDVFLMDRLVLRPTLALDYFDPAVLLGEDVAPEILEAVDDPVIRDRVAVPLSQLANVALVIAA
jgi:hypothetical protein